MLKIREVQDSTGATTLYLEGEILGPWLGEIRRCCDLVLSTGRHLTINLAEVSFVDREAMPMLRELAERHVALCDCSPFVAEQVKELGSM